MSLPPGWEPVRLDDVCHHVVDGDHQAPPQVAEGIPFITISAMNDHTLDLTRASRCVPQTYFDSLKPERRPAKGDVIYSVTGSFGIPALVNTDEKFTFQRHIALLKPNTGLISKEFLFYNLSSLEMKKAATKVATGTAQKTVSLNHLRSFRLSLPPLKEQRRIVARIEELTSRSKSAKEALQAIPPLLEKFRQSVLAAAFRGDLTAEWRRQNPNVESAAVLLERIRVERRCRWEESGARGKYVEPEPVDVTGLPELPKGWCWASLDLLKDPMPNSFVDGPFGSNLKTSDYTEAGARVVRLGNLGVGLFKDENRSFISLDKFALLTKHQIFSGDLLIAALAEPVGRCCKVPPDLGLAIVKADCIRFKPHSSVHPGVILHFLNSPTGRRFAEEASHGVGRLRINLASLRTLPVAIPTEAEQSELVLAIESFFAQTTTIFDSLNATENALNILGSSILSKGFRGELVTQDPNDEPASVLLERIRNQKKDQRPETRRNRP